MDINRKLRKKIKFLVVLLALVFHPIHAQKKIDEKAYSNETNIDKKISTGLELIWQWREEGKFKEAVGLGKEIEQLCLTNKKLKLLANCRNRIANIYDDLSLYDSALYYAEQSLAYNLETKNKPAISTDYTILGGINYKKTKYPDALSFYLKALSYRENTNDDRGLAQLYNNIGNIYKDLDDYSKSYDYRLKAIHHYRKINYEQGIAVMYVNFAYDLTSMQDSVIQKIKYTPKMRDDTIRHYLKYAIGAFEKLNIPFGKAAALGNLGLWLNSQGEYDSALVCEKMCYEMYKEMESELDMAAALGDMAMVYNSLKQYDLAIEKATEAKILAEKVENRFALTEIYKNLYKAHKAKGHLNEALLFHEKWKEMDDSLKNEDDSRMLTVKSMQFDFNKKTIADSLQNAEVQKINQIKHEEDIKQQRYFTFGGIIGFVLMLVIALVALKAYKQKQKDNYLIQQQKQIVEEHQKEILDSIHYAKRIQTAILAKPEEIKKVLPNSFQFYLPKDIVAGDFYFFEVSDEYIFYAAADCTGHGVPGALMSVICSNSLQRSVKEFGLKSTPEILNKTRELVIETLRKSGQDLKDGMDISIISILKKDIETKASEIHVEWTGANNPLWYIANNEFKEIKADKQPVGWQENMKEFSSHQLILSPGDSIYLITDGYADQFGGEKGKKFKYKQLLELLEKNKDYPADEQCSILSETFKNWKGNLEQVDDVTLIGIKF